jgi:3'-5' exoribonuclease
MSESGSNEILQKRVRDLKSGDILLQFFQLRLKERKKTRSGQEYFDLALSDSTGTISGKMWSEAIRKWGDDFNAGDVVKIHGRVESYKEHRQIVIEKIRRVDISEAPDPESLFRKPSSDPTDLLNGLAKIAETLEPTELSQLVRTLLDENREALMSLPAAIMVHHSYRGGLVEHIASVTRKIEVLLSVDETLDRNLALAGSILHDIGKVREFRESPYGRSLEGMLIGHLFFGVAMIGETAAGIGIASAEWLVELQHIVLSHHGETAFGSPVKPMTREALLVHFVDNLDAKLKIMSEALEESDTEGLTPYNRWLDGRVYERVRTNLEENRDD